MFDILVAGLRVRVKNRYDIVKARCADYIIPTAGTPDEVVAATDWQLQYMWENEKRLAPEAEFYCVHGHLYPRLPRYQAFRMHGVAVEMDGNVYVFTAPSDYGKTTHALLWLKAFGERARIINGDNPIIRLAGGEFIAYGTPFAGNEGYQVNASAPVRGVCYLTHSEENSIRPMEPGMAFASLVRDNRWCMTRENREPLLELLERFAQEVPVYQLHCNQSVEAAHVAYEGMRNGRASD